MNIFTHEVCCDVCGGPGVATSRGMSSQWTGGRLVHKDSRICEDYIKQAKEKDAKRIAELEKQLAAVSS